MGLNPVRTNTEKKNIFYGVEIKDYIKIKNIKIKFGESVIIILFEGLIQGVDIIDFFIITNFFLKKKIEVKHFFGLIMSPGLKFIRKKIKKEVTDEFSAETLTTLLSGYDHTIYYGNKFDIEQFLGVEIRYKEDHGLYKDRDSVLVELLFELNKGKRVSFKN